MSRLETDSWNPAPDTWQRIGDVLKVDVSGIISQARKKFCGANRHQACAVGRRFCPLPSSAPACRAGSGKRISPQLSEENSSVRANAPQPFHACRRSTFRTFTFRRQPYLLSLCEAVVPPAGDYTFITRVRFFLALPPQAAAVLHWLLKMAPEEGLEPSTTRLTVACSTIELLWNANGGVIYKSPPAASNRFIANLDSAGSKTCCARPGRCV